MINMPYDQIVTIIEEKSSLSKDEIEQKIKTKLDQLSGLISKEGAAHIIANELGIQLDSGTVQGGSETLKVKEVTNGARNVQILGRVVQKYELREFNSNGREGKVANFLLGDETGVMRVVMWNAMADNLEKLSEKDVVKITGAYARMNQNRVELHLNDNSVIEINPEGETVPEITQQRSEFERKKIANLSEADQEVEILGTIVQVFDPRFFEVDPTTGKRIRPREDNIFYNEANQPINPDYSYVFNLFVDDGTDNMRIVCFRNQMQRVLNKSHDEILEFRLNPQGFETIKHDLLGKMVKVQGRIVRNEMFDRLEMISNRIFTDINPQEELNKLNTQDTEKDSVKDDMQKNSDEQSRTQKPESSESKTMSLDDLENKTGSISSTSDSPSSAQSDSISSQSTSTQSTQDSHEEYTPDVSEVPKEQLDFKSASEVSEPVKGEEKKQLLDDDLGELDDLEELDSLDDM